MRRVIDTSDIKVYTDPHHGGDTFWILYEGEFWTRHVTQSKWTKVGRTHLTIARAEMFGKMVKNNKSGGS